MSVVLACLGNLHSWSSGALLVIYQLHLEEGRRLIGFLSHLRGLSTLFRSVLCFSRGRGTTPVPPPYRPHPTKSSYGTKSLDAI